MWQSLIIFHIYKAAHKGRFHISRHRHIFYDRLNIFESKIALSCQLRGSVRSLLYLTVYVMNRKPVVKKGRFQPVAREALRMICEIPVHEIF